MLKCECRNTAETKDIMPPDTCKCGRGWGGADVVETSQTEQAEASSLSDLVIYAIYSDKGPRGACGQSCLTTNPWRKLHIFYSHDKFREWARGLEKLSARKSPKLEYYWIKDDLCTDVVEHI